MELGVAPGIRSENGDDGVDGTALAARGDIADGAALAVLGVGAIDVDITDALLLNDPGTIKGVIADAVTLWERLKEGGVKAGATLATGVAEAEIGTARGVAEKTERGDEGCDIPPGGVEDPKKLLISPNVNPSFCIISRILLSPISILLILSYLEYLSELPPIAAEAIEDIIIVIVMYV